MSDHELILIFFFEFFQLVFTLVLSWFPGLVRPVLLALLLMKRGRRESFIEYRRELLLLSCSLLVRSYWRWALSCYMLLLFFSTRFLLLDRYLTTLYDLQRRFRIVRLSYHPSLYRTLFYDYQRSVYRFRVFYSYGLSVLILDTYNIIRFASYDRIIPLISVLCYELALYISSDLLFLSSRVRSLRVRTCLSFGSCWAILDVRFWVMVLPSCFPLLALLQARSLLLSLPPPTTLAGLRTFWPSPELVSSALLPRLCLSLALYGLLCPLCIAQFPLMRVSLLLLLDYWSFPRWPSVRFL